MKVTESFWLDDDTFIVDGQEMTNAEIGRMKTIPETVCMSSANKKLIDEIAVAGRAQVVDALRIILKKTK